MDRKDQPNFNPCIGAVVVQKLIYRHFNKTHLQDSAALNEIIKGNLTSFLPVKFANENIIKLVR